MFIERHSDEPCATCAETRRKLLKMLAAIPFVGTLLPLLSRKAQAAGPVRAAKLSQLKKPWDAVAFRYPTVIKRKLATGGEQDVAERIPGVVLRLPDDIAAKRGGGEKAKYLVVDLHCTHYRCEAQYMTDQKEFYQLSAKKMNKPAAILCPCHMTVFDVTNEVKPVKGGRAKKALAQFHFDVKGGEIVVTGLPKGASAFKPGRRGGLGSEYPVRPGEPGF